VTAYLASLAVLAGGGLAALLLARRAPGAALAAWAGSAALGALAGLGAALPPLAGGPAPELRAAWAAPLAELHLRIDALAAFFLVVVFGVALATAAFGRSYLASHAGRRSLGAHLLFFNLLVAAMSLVLTARHATLFMVAWEAMTVASFLLVTFEHEDPAVRSAGRLYLVASHLGGAAILALFLLLARGAGSLDFDAFAAARHGAAPATLLFALAVAGFGVKAGLFPLHVWLPEAHPAAPSHVSALMSGALVKTGLYGILRVLGFLPAPPAGWGIALALVGAAGALSGIALALGQRDLKRLLAWSTVENVGLVAAGLGAGLAGLAGGSGALGALALCGALLHVWGHAATKGLAFLGAGALAHAAGTRDLERMGGLLRRLPLAGGLFVLAAAGLSALPPLAGFASEWLVYLGLLDVALHGSGAAALAACATFVVLAVVGAFALVVFTRAAGVALLGEPRSEEAARAHEPGPGLLAPLAGLAAACLVLGAFPGAALPSVARVAGEIAGVPIAPPAGAEALAGAARVALLALGVAAAAIALARRRLLAGRARASGATWGCGFALPGPRMQYTAGSYAQLAAALLPAALRPRDRVEAPAGALPRRARFALERGDPALTRLFDPLFRRIADRSARLRQLQQNRLNLQLLYTFATLVGLAVALAIRARLR
jgi:formate hydrogenlyase subunit 3/multisubunit Na+/H+ antiporter MnhD subunit